MTDSRSAAKKASEPNENVSKIIRLAEFSRAQKPIVIRIAQTLQNKQNVIINIMPANDPQNISYRGTKTQMHEVLSRTFDELIGRIKAGEDLRADEIKRVFKNLYTEVSRELDPNRQKKIKPVIQIVGIKPKLTSHYYYDIASEDVPQVDKLIRLMEKSRRSLAALGELKSIDETELNLEGKTLKVLLPCYEAAKDTDEAKLRVLQILKKIVASIDPVSNKHLTHTAVKTVIASTAAPIPIPIRTDTNRKNDVVRDVAQSGLTFKRHGFDKWAQDIDKAGRSACLRAFGQHPELGFSVTLSKPKGEVDGLLVKFANKGTLDFNQNAIVLHILQQMQAKWRKSPNVTVAIASQWLKDIWAEIDQASETEHGDHLKLVFEKKAKPTVETIALNASFKDATSKLERGVITPKMNIELPVFNKDGALHLRHESGVTQDMIPTDNQVKLMNAIRDPYFQYIVCQGPVGAGKTLWACYAALQLLQQGHVFKIYYDRPLEGAGGAKIGYLKGDLDDKMGPYHGPFEKAFAKILGVGNIPSGQAKFKELTDAKIIERYDQIFQRGDTAEDCLLIIDEAQNKTRDEIYHLITRPDENSKLLLMGDGEFQVDFQDKSKSGFLEMSEIYGGIDKFAFTHLDENDIKRSPTIQQIYLARRAFEAAAKGAKLSSVAHAASATPSPSPGIA